MKIKHYIKRTAPTNSRVTYGKIYELVNGKISDDYGNPMSPTITECGTYWRDYTSIPPAPAAPTPNSSLINNPTSQLIPAPINQKGNRMLNIKETTLINGSDASTFTVDTLIDLIKQEEAKIQNLDEIKSESKAIAKIKKQHGQNVKALLKLLDEKEV